MSLNHQMLSTYMLMVEKVIQSFLSAGLIQEMIITRAPIIIGAGIPLFGVLQEDIKLKHIETQSFNNGLVQSKYNIII